MSADDRVKASAQPCMRRCALVDQRPTDRGTYAAGATSIPTGIVDLLGGCNQESSAWSGTRGGRYTRRHSPPVGLASDRSASRSHRLQHAKSSSTSVPSRSSCTATVMSRPPAPPACRRPRSPRKRSSTHPELAAARSARPRAAWPRRSFRMRGALPATSARPTPILPQASHQPCHPSR